MSDLTPALAGWLIRQHAGYVADAAAHAEAALRAERGGDRNRAEMERDEMRHAEQAAALLASDMEAAGVHMPRAARQLALWEARP